MGLQGLVWIHLPNHVHGNRRGDTGSSSTVPCQKKRLGNHEATRPQWMSYCRLFERGLEVKATESSKTAGKFECPAGKIATHLPWMMEVVDRWSD